MLNVEEIMWWIDVHVYVCAWWNCWLWFSKRVAAAL